MNDGRVGPTVIQAWIGTLTLMQQSVLLAAIRGPDGIAKDHISKKLVRWYRRCVLVAAFDRIIYLVPYDDPKANWRSGSFTGPSCYIDPIYTTRGFVASLDDTLQKNYPVFHTWQEAMDEVLRRYLKSVDEIPHHYQLHFMHAAEILGYKHPNRVIRAWWHQCYCYLVNDMHLTPEREIDMDHRLGDNEAQWAAREGAMADR